MTEQVKYKDWDETDFRYAEERIRMTAVIRSVAAERKFGYATVQNMSLKKRYRIPRATAALAFIIVHFQRKEWVEAGSSRHVPARLYFNEDCALREIEPNPEWGNEEG